MGRAGVGLGCAGGDGSMRKCNIQRHRKRSRHGSRHQVQSRQHRDIKTAREHDEDTQVSNSTTSMLESRQSI